jgi:NAD(P)-dependent dehydrogenase (short-subunit alcohol dehydrogenase family)
MPGSHPAEAVSGLRPLVTIASALGLVAAARSGYAASQGTIAQLTRILAVELAGTGIAIGQRLITGWRGRRGRERVAAWRRTERDRRKTRASGKC